MEFLLKFFGGAFALIALYLIITNYKGVNEVLTSFARGSSTVFSTLQGNKTTVF